MDLNKTETVLAIMALFLGFQKELSYHTKKQTSIAGGLLFGV
ncbi:hypothetical protein [Paenibacillus tianjinensis]|nr:hypothetical protein [Paenibacillus tianjinensis]